MKRNNQKIPEGWSVKKLKECLEIKHGKPQHDVENQNGIYPILASGGEIGRTNSFLCNKPSVLIGRKGTIDKPQYMDTPFWTVDTLFYSLIKSGYLAKYIFYKFETINWNKYNEGSTIPSLSSSTIHSIKVLLPPLAEQEKIAEILGTWDEAIEKLSSLIEQKKFLKKGLMQKLLTGKVRLPGFTQPWKEVKLGEITEFISGYSFDSNDFKKNGVPLIRISNIENDKISLDNDSVFLDLSFLQKYPNYCIKYGDLLLAMSGATTGKMGINKSNIPMLLNQRVGIIRAKMSWQSFLNQYLMRFNNKILQMSYGGAQPNIGSNDIKKIKLYIPSDISEQQAIANVLSTADDEIDLLNKKLILFKEQKKGLMQQLLTGNIRVKVN